MRFPVALALPCILGACAGPPVQQRAGVLGGLGGALVASLRRALGARAVGESRVPEAASPRLVRRGAEGR